MKALRSMIAVAGIVAAALTGCAERQTPTSSTAAPSPTSALTSTSPSTPNGPNASNGQQYTVTPTTIEGDSDDGRGSWRAEFSQLAGGDPAVVEAFNGASHAAVMDQVEAAKEGARDGTTTWEFESNTQVTFRSIAVAQIVFGSSSFGAHPSHEVGTIVIDSRSADPIMLVDLFSDPQAGSTGWPNKPGSYWPRMGWTCPPTNQARHRRQRTS